MQKQKTKDLEDILKKAGALEKDRILKEIRDVSFVDFRGASRPVEIRFCSLL